MQIELDIVDSPKVCGWCNSPVRPNSKPEWTYPNGQVAYCCGLLRCALRHKAYANPCIGCGWWHSDCYCPKCQQLVPEETDWRNIKETPDDPLEEF